MGLIVQKFGGTSVADAEKIHRAAKRAIAAKNKRATRSSSSSRAMGDTTDDLITLASEVCKFGRAESSMPPKREMDQLLATGEQVTIALMAMAIHAQGHEAISFTGGQIGLVTDNAFSKARIQSINKATDFRAACRREDRHHRRVSRASRRRGITPRWGAAGAMPRWWRSARCCKADVCENYTDVDGIYTADPRIVPNARKIDRISYDEMLELSGLGASVLQTRAVEFAKKYRFRSARAQQPE